MTTPLLLLGVPRVVLDDDFATGSGEVFALPARASYIAWQVVISADEDVTVILEVSIDGENWVTLDTITLTGSELTEVRTAGPTAAQFGRMSVTVNASEVDVLGTIICKPAD